MPEIPIVSLGEVHKKRAISYRSVQDEPPPERKPGVVRDDIFDLLGTLQPRECVEVDRNKRSVQNYIYKFRKLYGKDLAFRVRVSRYGWCKIWRVR
jgi:hypothetical protein